MFALWLVVGFVGLNARDLILFTFPFTDKSYFSQKVLNLHVKDITKGKTFNCTYCSKSFNRRGELDLHNRSHTNERYDFF